MALSLVQTRSHSAGSPPGLPIYSQYPGPSCLTPCLPTKPLSRCTGPSPPLPCSRQAQLEDFNRALDGLTQHSKDAQGLLDPKGPRRKELSAAVAKAAAAAAGGAAAGPAAGPAAPTGLAGPGGPPAPAGAARRPAPPPGGKLEGPELLLAAVGYGAGL